MYQAYINLIGVSFSEAPVEFLVISAVFMIGVSFALDLFVSLFSFVFRRS